MRRCVPKPDYCTAAKEAHRFSSIDQLVGEQLYRVGHLNADCPGCLQVDDELEFRRLQHRQIGGLGASGGGIAIIARRSLFTPIKLDDQFHETDHIGCDHSFLAYRHFAGTS